MTKQSAPFGKSETTVRKSSQPFYEWKTVVKKLSSPSERVQAALKKNPRCSRQTQNLWQGFLRWRRAKQTHHRRLPHECGRQQNDGSRRIACLRHDRCPTRRSRKVLVKGSAFFICSILCSWRNRVPLALPHRGFMVADVCVQKGLSTT